MKLKIKPKHFICFTMIFSISCFTSCQDDFENDTVLNSQYTIKDYSLQQASKIAKFEHANQKFMTRVNSINNVKNRNTSRDSLNNFSIDSTSIKEISIGDYTTYTMRVIRDQPNPNYFENVVLEINAGITKEYLIKYTPTTPITEIETHDSYIFNGTVEKVRGPSTFFGNNDNGDDYSPPADGGGAGTDCVRILMCDYEYTHVAGTGCARTYPKIICRSTEGGGNIPFVNYSIPTNESNNSQSNNQYNSQSGGSGSSTVITTPIIPPVIIDEKKCELFNKLKTDNYFKGIINALKADVGLTYEQGVALSNTAAGGYNIVIGTANAIYDYAVTFDIPNGMKIDILTHNHYTGGLSIFSPADLEQMYKTIKNAPSSHSIQNFVSVVVNPSGETYAITISDRSKFLAWGLDKFSTIAKFETFKIIYDYVKGNPILPGYGINNNSTNAENEKNFLQMLGNNTGLKVHKANADLSQWNPLKLNSNNQVEPESACN